MFRFTKITFFAAFMLILAQLDAQTSYKRYPTMEHFTNSWCSSCASRNPALFSYLTSYEGQYHHMTIHPNVPYQGCVFYQANVAENTERKNYYSVSSTPRLFLNGTFVSTGAALLPPATFTAALAQTSQLGIGVTETTGTNRTAQVKLHAISSLPAGDYVLRVALVEKTINYASPNGEQIHHNVFRKFLTPVAGLPVTGLTAGAKLDFSYNYAVDAAWNANEIYVLAFLQNNSTKEILNSGTRFDNFVLDASDVQNEIALAVTPNPANEFFTVQSTEKLVQLNVFNLQGKRVFEQQNPNGTIDVSNWESGVYLVKATTRTGTKTVKLVVN
jgi:hypothetical protein